MIYLDAIYYAFITHKGKYKGKPKNFKEQIKRYNDYKYIIESSIIKSYLKRTKKEYTNYYTGTETLDFLAKYIFND